MEGIEVTHQEAQIEIEDPGIEPYLAQIKTSEYNFRLIFGKTPKNTVYLCIPDRAAGFELNSLRDVNDNIDNMVWNCDHLDYEYICAIAFALEEISYVIKMI